jgi:hypothetical protein
MTDEERRKLITDLKAARPGYPPGELCIKAADEIERLATENERLKEQRAAWEQTSRVALALVKRAERTEEIERLAERVKNLEGRLEAVQRM